MPTPTRYPSGVAMQRQGLFLGDYPLLNPAVDHVYFNDFDTYTAGDWTITTTSGSNALVAATNGGVLRLTTAAGASDIQGIQKNPLSFAIASGGRAWFGGLFTIAANATTVFRAGLMTGGTVLAPTDGVYFSKAVAAAIDFNIKTGGNTTTLTGVGGTPTDGTPFALGFYVDGRGNISVFSSIGQPTVSLSSPTGGAVAATTSVLTYLPTSVLSPTIAVQTPTGAKTLDVDYVIAAAEIARY